jgi:tetratricopeptide (TPR) repeat protein
MNWRRLIVLNRLPIAIVIILLGVLLTATVKHAGWWTWILFLVAILMIVAHFMIGPMSLIQKHVEDGDIEGAQGLLARVKKPDWLYKPIRSAYYMMQSQLGALDQNQDLDKAEADIRKGLASSSGQKEIEGGAYMQLGTIALRKGNNKEAFQHLKKSLELGLPDINSEAGVYLQLSNLSIGKKDYRSAKHYFNKAVSCKPTDKTIKDQITEYKKYISRIPG